MYYSGWVIWKGEDLSEVQQACIELDVLGTSLPSSASLDPLQLKPAEYIYWPI